MLTISELKHDDHERPHKGQEELGVNRCECIQRRFDSRSFAASSEVPSVTKTATLFVTRPKKKFQCPTRKFDRFDMELLLRRRVHMVVFRDRT